MESVARRESCSREHNPIHMPSPYSRACRDRVRIVDGGVTRPSTASEIKKPLLSSSTSPSPASVVTITWAPDGCSPLARAFFAWQFLHLTAH
jgi:hypothetical protein